MKEKRWFKRFIAITCIVAVVGTMLPNLAPTEVEAAKELEKVTITNCDSTEGITLNGNTTLTTDANYVNEGTGAFYRQNPAREVFALTFGTSVDITGAEGIGMKLFVENFEIWNGLVRINISSNKNPDVQCVKWTIDKSILKNGWNDLLLLFSEAAYVGSDFNYSGLNYIKIWQSGGNASGSANIVTALDDVYAFSEVKESTITAKAFTEGTITGGVAPQDTDYDSEKYVFGGWYKDEAFTTPLTQGEQVAATPEAPVYAKLVPTEVLTTKAQMARTQNTKLVLEDCESKDNVTTNAITFLSTDAKYVKEGNGAFLVQNPSRILSTITWNQAVDISAYEALHISLFIEDLSVWNGKVRVDISSNGNPDGQSLKWVIDKATLQSGWNELWLDFNNPAGKGSASFNPNNFNFIRIWQSDGDASTNVNLAIDDIYAYRENANGKNLFSCDEADAAILKSIYGAYNTDKTYIKEGNGSFTNPETGVGMSMTFNYPVDITDYQNGTLRFWIHVANRSEIDSVK